MLLLPLNRVRHAVPLVCLLLILVCTTAQGLALRGIVHVANDYNINPLFRLDAPAWGVLAAWWLRRHPASPRASLVALAIGLLATAWQAWAFALAFDPAAQAVWHFAAWQPAYGLLRVTTTSLGLAAVVAGARGVFRRPVPVLSAVAGPVAALSYALYLTHIPVIFLAKLYLPSSGNAWADHLIVALLVVAASLLLRYAVERPVLALRDRLVPDRPVPERRAVPHLV